MLLPQKGQLFLSNTEESVVCLIEKVYFKNKSQMDEIIHKQHHLQSFFYFSSVMEKETKIAYLYDSSCSL